MLGLHRIIFELITINFPNGVIFLISALRVLRWTSSFNYHLMADEKRGNGKRLLQAISRALSRTWSFDFMKSFRNMSNKQFHSAERSACEATFSTVFFSCNPYTQPNFISYTVWRNSRVTNKLFSAPIFIAWTKTRKTLSWTQYFSQHILHNMLRSIHYLDAEFQITDGR